MGSEGTTTGQKLLGWACTLNGVTVRLDSFEIDQSNDLAEIPNQGDSAGTGIQQFYRKSSAPKAKISIEVPRIASLDLRTYWINSTISTLILSNGGTGASLFTIKAARAQIEKRDLAT